MRSNILKFNVTIFLYTENDITNCYNLNLLLTTGNLYHFIPNRQFFFIQDAVCHNGRQMDNAFCIIV